MPSLSDKLKLLGVQVGARHLPVPAPRRHTYAIEQVLDGRFQPTPLGAVFVLEKQYPPDYRHGRAELAFKASLQTIAGWANDERLAGCTAPSLAFLDTETTGLSGGTGTFAFLIGVGRFQNGNFHLVQFFMRDPSEEPAQLAALAQFIHPCDTLVTFNGKAFDAPLLNTRYIANSQPSPLPEMAHLDLLPLARRLWRDRLPSRALGQLEQHILQAARTHHDIPGWLIPGVYFDYLRSGDARPLKGVFYHNAMDILAMAGLLTHITHILEDPCDGRVEHGVDLLALGRLFESLGRPNQAIRLYRHSLRRPLPPDSYAEILYRLSLAQKRQGNWAEAVALWQQAAGQGRIYAHVELAKYYEHQLQDFQQAARWTQRALALVSLPHTPRASRRRWRPELEHRLARLERKLGGPASN